MSFVCKVTGCKNPGPFISQQGLKMHDLRTHSKKAKDWGKGNQFTPNKKRIGRFPISREINQILEQHPEGIHIRQVAELLKQEGYKKDQPISSIMARVSSSLLKNTKAIGVGTRTGIYKLRQNKTKTQLQSTKIQEPQIEQEDKPLPREVLELHFAQLRKRDKALRECINSLLNATLV